MLMMSKMHALAIGGDADAGPYVANAVDFDGTNDYLLRGSDLTGTVDSSTGILSAWLRFDGGNGTNLGALYNDTQNVRLVKNSSDKLRMVLGTSAGGTKQLIFETATAYTAGATWLHILASWDTNFSAGNKIGQLYVNDANDYSLVSDTATAFNVDYTAANWSVGARTVGDQTLNGCMADLYFAPNQYLDFSVEANRRKFISASGKPVNLGSDGSLPTGSAPIVYLNNPAASFGTNKGTGGDFTITGSLDTASTSPSD